MSEIMNGDEINEIERYIPSGNPDALHRPLRNVVASHRALQAKVRELEGQVADYAEQLETRDAYGQMQAKISDLEAKLRQVEQERDQLRARVGELEALNHKLNKALVFAEHGRTLERLQDSEAQRALEGKEEHGTKSND